MDSLFSGECGFRDIHDEPFSGAAGQKVTTLPATRPQLRRCGSGSLVFWERLRRNKDLQALLALSDSRPALSVS